jgi:predicted nucleic acid-binding Zn ribbon protein
MPPDICPICGADVPPDAKACPGCGADEETGWSEKARYDSMGIPTEDEDFDYEEFVKREFEGEKPRRKRQSLWRAVAMLILLLIAWFIFQSVFGR